MTFLINRPLYKYALIYVVGQRQSIIGIHVYRRMMHLLVDLLMVKHSLHSSRILCIRDPFDT